MTPNHGPKISGGQPRYQIGDTVRVNCTSAPSKPVCHLSWLINGEPAQKQHLKQYDKIVMGRDSLEMARLGLEFRVRGYHFKNGDMKLKVSLVDCNHIARLIGIGLYFQCVAKISSLYWQSNEESVESDRQQRAPALESRETVAAKSSTIGKSLWGMRIIKEIEWLINMLALQVLLPRGSHRISSRFCQPCCCSSALSDPGVGRPKALAVNWLQWTFGTLVPLKQIRSKPSPTLGSIARWYHIWEI